MARCALNAPLVALFMAGGYAGRHYQPINCPWYAFKTEPSFADMLAALRRQSVRQKVFSLALRGPDSRKIKQLLETTLATAA